MKTEVSTTPMTPLWDAARSYQRVILRDIVTEVRLGLHPWERHPERPQRIVVNVELFAHLDGSFGGRDAIVDYDAIRNALKAWPTRDHVDLIETLLEELVALCFRYPQVEACRVSIIKPDIFNEAGGAGVEVYRVRG
jgi:7,8-dihydroneopterin aldolase/epimerase/oxygenase